MVRAHVFINWDPVYFLKQSPDKSNIVDGVEFTFGLVVPEDIDVLIVHTRSSYSIPTRLPKERTVFVAGEPDVIHPFSRAFLEQFGTVLTTSPVELETEKLRENYCLHWFAGVDFKAGISIDTVKGYDWFKALKDPPRKKNRISIITSTRSNTPFHKRRMKFIEHVDKHHSDVIDVFGRGRRQVGDKLEALLDYKYHIALENGGAPYTWTEKLADPLLAWTFPFHWGCSNADEELPGGAFDHIDINDPVKTVNSILASLEKGIWDNALQDIAHARALILERYNTMFMLVRLAKHAMDRCPIIKAPVKRRLIRSEQSLPLPRGRQTSLAKRLARLLPVLVYPHFDIIMARAREQYMQSPRRVRKTRCLKSKP